MSSIANLPYGEILDYWYERLEGHKDRNKFLVTKLIEAFTFQSKTNTEYDNYEFIAFPKGRKHQLTIKPQLAIVIPVFVNSKKDIKDIENLIQSIHQLEYPPDMVILVDDGSSIGYEYPDSYFHHKHKQNCGPAKARNTGIKIALENGMEIIAFTDSDCILDKAWTKQLIFHFQKKSNCSIVSGNTISYDKQWLGTYHNMNGTLNGRKFKNSERLLYGTTANLAITAEVAKRIKFNESFPNAAGEDIEFCFRANQAGFKILHQEKMIVHHNYGYNNNIFTSLRKFRNQFKRYSKGEQELLKLVPEYYVYLNETVEIRV